MENFKTEVYVKKCVYYQLWHSSSLCLILFASHLFCAIVHAGVGRRLIEIVVRGSFAGATQFVKKKCFVVRVTAWFCSSSLLYLLQMPKHLEINNYTPTAPRTRPSAHFCCFCLKIVIPQVEI